MIATLLPLLFTLLQLLNLAQASPWVIVFDCGSTKTTVYAYKFQNREVIQVNSKKWRRGLGEINPRVAANQRLIKINVASILTNAASGISSSQKPATKVYVYATAGLRAIPSSRADALLRCVDDAVRNNGFSVDSANSKVINGRAEAAYAWIAVNSMTSSDINTQLANQDNTVVDLGGSSTQVAFRPDGRITVNRNNIIAMQSRSQGNGVFVKSINGLGDRMMIILIADASRCNETGVCDGQEFVSPCLHNSFSATFVHGRHRFTIKGNPNLNSQTRYAACKARIERVMDEFNLSIHARYVHLLSQSLSTIPVIGISGMYYSARYVNSVVPLTYAGTTCNGYRMTIDKFKEGAERLCANPDNSDDRYKPYACTQAAYIYMLLSGYRHGYRWQTNQDFYACRKFRSRGNANLKIKASWALGVALQNVRDDFNTECMCEVMKDSIFFERIETIDLLETI